MNPQRGLEKNENDLIVDPTGLTLDAAVVTGFQSGQATAKKAADILVKKNCGFVVPTALQRQNLLVAFAKKGKVVYGRAFDLVKLARDVDLDELIEVELHLASIILVEIKATKKPMPESFQGFFFSLTGGEVLVAQSLKSQFCFALVNTSTGHYLEMPLSEVFSRARGIYPTWSVNF